MSGGFDVVGASFAARRNILSARPFQNLLGPLDPLRILAVNREQNAAVFNPAFVAFRFIFGNPHANQRARDATDGPSYACARQRSHPLASPSTTPVPAPVVAPSGALVPFSWAKSFVPELSGSNTEMSRLLNPAAFRPSTPISTVV